ncbi:MAG: HD-GYP domain-containing protein [Peptococcaceae bacterium]|nr:HD-GYP domain-containing protein [Peptococcaceae bacterium]
MEGLVCVDLAADDLAAVLSRLNKYTLIISILLFVLVTVAGYKFSEVLADRTELYSGSVNSLVDSINAKDSYTRKHSLNVARYATLLAKELKLSSKDVRSVNILARLHDIGKIGVRDDVLNKPSSLNQEELNIIRMHPVIGSQILDNIKRMRKHLAIIRNHHERFDGKGYPDGLKGEEIPLVARILSVADSFDAMTTTRPYRPAMSHREAILELEKNMGTQFDPLVVEAFQRIYSKGKVM